MKFRLAAAALALSPVYAAIAQTPAGEPEITPEAVRAHVAFLADDLLEGRKTGTRGYDLAARYVATRFEALGLKPANGQSWYQQVPFVEATLADPAPVVIIGGTAFTGGKDVIVGASRADADLKVEAPVVFAGFGLDDPALGFDDYAGLDVRGRFVAVISGAPKGTPSDVAAHLSAEKLKMAERRGALGVITIPSIEDDKRRPWATRVKFASSPSIGWVQADGKPYSAAPGLRTGATLDRAAAEALFAGSRAKLSAVLAAADRKGDKPKGFALARSVAIAVKSSLRRFESPNVVAVLPGSDPALANEYVLLMAHLDHEGVNDKKTEGDRIYNGAMDNAAGTATMLEAARAFVESGVRPKRSIVFAAVTAEEEGLLGSEYLAKHPLPGADGKPMKIAGVVNLDMPILLYDFQDLIAFGAEHSTLGPIAERAAARAGVKLSPDPLPQENLFTRSDHYRFVQAGVPSIFLMTGFAGEGATKFQHFLKTDYHKVSDQIDLPFNWDAGAKFARINYLIAREIADAPEAPRWYQGSFFGDKFAKDATKAEKPAK